MNVKANNTNAAKFVEITSETTHVRATLGLNYRKSISVKVCILLNHLVTCFSPNTIQIR